MPTYLCSVALLLVSLAPVPQELLHLSAPSPHTPVLAPIPPPFLTLPTSEREIPHGLPSEMFRYCNFHSKDTLIKALTVFQIRNEKILISLCITIFFMLHVLISIINIHVPQRCLLFIVILYSWILHALLDSRIGCHGLNVRI